MIDLDELERLCREATPEPWEVRPDRDDEPTRIVHEGPTGYQYWLVEETGGRAKGANYEDYSECLANAALIATLRNAAPELIAMARRYQWLREHWARVVMTTSYAGANVPRSVELIELGDHILGKVDPDTLDAAIDAAMQKKPCGECHLQPGERCDICGAMQEQKP